MNDPRLDLLREHSDLLSQDKQAVARWLCETWAENPCSTPKWLQHRYWSIFPFQLSGKDARQKLAQFLILELLAEHKQIIIERQRLAST